MKKRWRIGRVGAIAAAVAACGLLMAAVGTDFKLGRDIEILINMFRDVSVFYVDATESDKLLEDAAQGLTLSLDPYTQYMPASEMEDFEMLTTGKYAGIGSVIRQRGDYVVISEPYEGSPADNAGLRIGDKILEIEGRSARGMDAAEVRSLLRGDPGTSIKVKVEHTSGQVEEVKVRRERITIPGVPYYGFLSEGIGYIQHVDFNENCSEDMHRAIMELRGQGRLDALVLDYRSNGGGLLTEAVKILSLFVPKGTEVVSMRGRAPGTVASFHTESEPVEPTLPLVVLTNSGSASASEIVAGALQDLDRAVVVGQRTFGKGLVQATRPLGYNSYLKITTAKYYLPSGRGIQAVDYTHRNEDGSVGLIPDSLINEYRTRGGRKVYDGGGVMPDVRLEPEYMSAFTYMIYARGYIEDFADRYLLQHPQAPDIAAFRLSDAAYGDFVAFMEDKDVEYRSQTKAALDDLKAKAERELYLDGIRDDIAAIETKLKDDKRSNLALYRPQIAEMIEGEIVLRYYYSRGVTRYKLTRDPEIGRAAELLRDGERYAAILASQDTERK